ncbi:hypothetical protein HYFRA_00002906 [Hymenoscyphus fraxineus]|uniref:Uncharacterized protein n=1 Tax=Hymenoscyphus fraxineus TaxID=746836 RepID=A0A9N9KP21_9HELO|nr:hypothetical protein HYFRA_00002906 [Hymenoscyphus fraxineus]
MADRIATLACDDTQGGTDPVLAPNSGSEKRQTLATIPREVRDKILAELLSIDNNTSFDVFNDLVRPPERLEDEPQEVQLDFALLPPTPHERKVHWDVSTAVFFINKDISAEAIECFHRENILVSVETAGYRFIKNCASQIIPLRQTAHREKDVALHLKLGFRDEHNTPAGVEGAVPEFAVMAARHLPILVQLINATSITRQRLGGIPRENDIFFIRMTNMTLDFNTGSKYYAKNAMDVAGKVVVDGLKGLRQFRWSPWSLWWPPQQLIHGILARNLGVKRSITINGLSAQKTEEFIAASNLPYLTSMDYFAEAKRLKTHGDHLSQDGQYATARAFYILSAWIITEQPVPRRLIFSHTLFSTRDCDGSKILLAAWSGTARMGAKLSPNSMEAQTLEYSVMTSLEVILGASRFSPVVQEEMLAAYGHELLKHHEYDKFIDILEMAINSNKEDQFGRRNAVLREMGLMLQGSESERKELRSNCQKYITQCQEEKERWLAGAATMQGAEFFPKHLHEHLLS